MEVDADGMQQQLKMHEHLYVDLTYHLQASENYYFHQTVHAEEYVMVLAASTEQMHL